MSSAASSAGKYFVPPLSVMELTPSTKLLVSLLKLCMIRASSLNEMMPTLSPWNISSMRLMAACFAELDFCPSILLDESMMRRRSMDPITRSCSCGEVFLRSFVRISAQLVCSQLLSSTCVVIFVQLYEKPMHDEP